MARNYARTPYLHLLRRESDGSPDTAIDGSTTPEEFYWQCKNQCHIHLISVQIRDQGQFSAAGYGKQTTPLQNGVLLVHQTKDLRNGVVRSDLNPSLPIQRNSDWALFARTHYFDIGQGDNFLTVRFRLADVGGYLHMMPGDRIVAVVQDNLSFLEQQYFSIQGFDIA